MSDIRASAGRVFYICRNEACRKRYPERPKLTSCPECEANVGAGYDIRIRGKRYRQTRFATTREARAEMRAMIEEVRTPGKRPPDMTVAEWMAQWVEQVRVSTDEQKGKRPGTILGYRGVIDRYIVGSSIADIPIRDLTRLDVDEWVTALTASGGKGGAALSPRTAHNAVSVLSKALDDLIRGSNLDWSNPAKGASPSKPRKVKAVPWNPDELSAFVAVAQRDRYWAAWALALGLGMRRGEIVGLEWRHVDLSGERAVISIRQSVVAGDRTQGETWTVQPPKTEGGVRDLLAPDFVTDALRARKAEAAREALALGTGLSPETPVFLAQHGGRVTPDYLSQRWRELNQASELPEDRWTRLHDARHRFVSALLDAGESLAVVAQYAGHRDPTVTSGTYDHPRLRAEVNEKPAETMEGVFRNLANK